MSKVRTWGERTLAGLVLALAAFGLSCTDLARHMERRTEDHRLRWASARWAPATNVVVIALDDESLQRLEDAHGRWPWPRDVLADVVRHCSEARVVAIDILLAERDLGEPTDDRALALSAAGPDAVVAAALLSDEGEPLPSAFALRGAVTPPPRSLRRERVLLPYDELLRSVRGLGLVNSLVDDDGVFRSALAFGFAGDATVEALPVAAVRQGGLPVSAEPDGRALQSGARRFELDDYGRFLLMPRRATHRSLSFADVWEAAQAGRGAAGGVSSGVFRDAWVFIGSTATGLQDDRYLTSRREMQPGVHIMAQAADQLMNGPALRRASTGLLVLLLAVLACGVAFLPAERPRVLLAVALVVPVVWVAASLAALRFAGVVWPVTPLVVWVALWLAVQGAHSWIAEWRRRREMEALERVKQRFTDMLVHDLRNQTGPVVMALSLLEDRAAKRGDAEELRWSRTAHASAIRLVGQIDNLLDIRRMEEGRMELERRLHNLNELVREALDAYAPAAERAGMSFAFDPPADAAEWRVPVDAALFSRILGNLIWNALKYGREGSAIEVSLARTEAGVCALSVANRGEPIPVEDQAGLFAPFRVLARHSSMKGFRGAGLGLAFCRMAAEAHGGRITLESPWRPHGDGVRVTLQLPDENPQHTRART
jgi:signal transduction histidine kinase